MQDTEGSEGSELHPRGVGDVLDAAARVYRGHATTLLQTVAAVLVPIQVALAAGTALVVFGALGVDGGGGGGTAAAGSAVAGFVGLGLLSFVGSVVATGAALGAVTDAMRGRDPDWSESVRFALARFSSLVWVALLAGFLTVLASFAFVIPGVYLFVAWSVAVPVLLVESERGWAALRRSRQLVRGRWWPTLATLAVLYLLTSVVAGLASGVLQSALSLAGDTETLGGYLTESLTSLVGQVLVMPYTAAVIAVLYVDLRVRRGELEHPPQPAGRPDSRGEPGA